MKNYLWNWTSFSLPFSLEADKIQIEIELNQLKQKCSVANDDLKEMTTKCHNLEDELMKEKLTNQYGQHYANIPSASKSINTVSQEVGQSMLKWFFKIANAFNETLLGWKSIHQRFSIYFSWNTCLEILDSMALNTGFQEEYILYLWCMLPQPAKISLRVISILFVLLSAYCEV